MSVPESTTTRIHNLLGQLREGNVQARHDLLELACERLRSLASRMLRKFPTVHRWEQTDDVLQNSLLRLCRALETVQPSSEAEFMKLAARQIRWELLDLAKHHRGAEADAKHHHTDGKPADDAGGSLDREGNEPESLDDWTAFHEQVEALPEKEKEIMDLLFYQEMTQAEAAEVLGVTVRTVKNYWHNARFLLTKALKDQRR